MNSCINFNPAFGDISFIGNDLELSRDRNNTFYQNIIRLFKTNKNDYKLNENYGLNLENYFGKAVSDSLAEEIKSSIEDKLVSNELIASTSGVEILYIVSEHTIYFRIIIPGLDSINLEFLQEKGFEIE